MGFYEDRVSQDIIKINELSRITRDRIKILRTDGNPINQVDIQLKFNTVFSSKYPNENQKPCLIRIEMLSRYPFGEKPVKATFIPAIFHPNVYQSGLVCLGKTLPTEFLDLLVKRLIQIMVYEKSVINVGSAANREAVEWYTHMWQKQPKLFPTEDISDIFNRAPDNARIRWRNLK